jgi:hypothetical protein
MRTLFFFRDGVFNSVASYKYANTELKDHAFGTYFNYHLFAGPLVNSLDTVQRISRTPGADISSSDNLFLIFDCLKCSPHNQETGGFQIVLKQ